jgi:hypothetical protein
MMMFLWALFLLGCSAMAKEERNENEIKNLYPNMTLYAGHNAAGDVVCNLAWNMPGTVSDGPLISEYSWNFNVSAVCQDNKARSMKINKAIKGTVIRVFDSKYGNEDGHFTIIRIKKDITKPYKIPSFQINLNTKYVELQFNKNTVEWGYGLDAQVSRLSVDIDDIVVAGKWYNWSEWSSCSRTCGRGSKLRRRDCNSPAPSYKGKRCVGHNKDVAPCSDVTFCNAFLTLYSGGAAAGDLVCGLEWKHGKQEWNFNQDTHCENDKARSVTISRANAGTTITIYDSPEGNKKDGFSVIDIKKDITKPVTIPTFDKSYSDEVLNVVYTKDAGWFGIGLFSDDIDGNVSLVKIESP